MPYLLVLSTYRLHPTVNNIDGQRKHNGCVLLNSYFGKSLQITELDGGALRLENLGSFGQFRGGLELAVRVNNFCAPLAFGFSLTGDGALHLLGDVDLFHFNFADLDAPGLGFRIENDLQLGVDFVALGENFVELELADDAADGGLRELRGCVLVVLHLGQSEIGVDDAEITDGVHFHGDIVARDDVLRRDVQRFDAHAHARKRFDGPEHKAKAGAFGLRQHSAEAEDHAALPLFDDVQGIPEPDEHEADHDQRAYTEELEHVFLLNPCDSNSLDKVWS